MFRKSLAMLALTLCAATAFALPKPSEVKAAFAAGNYAKAESMVKEVLASKPSAHAHWDLGQIYAAEGKHSLALNEMRQAQALDPALKFASSSAAFIKAVGNEQAIVAPPAAVVASPIAIPQVYATATPATTPVATPDSGGHGIAIFVFIVIPIIVLGIALFFYRRNKNSETAAAAKEITNKKATLLELSKKLEDAALIARSHSYSAEDQLTISTRIAGLQNSVRTCLAEIKDGTVPSNATLARLESLVDDACNQAQNGVPPVRADDHPVYGKVDAIRDIPTPMPPYAPPVSDEHRAPPGAYAEIKTRVTSPGYVVPTQTHTTFHHYPAPPPASNNDFLTGMLVGDMMNRHQDRTVYVEQAPAPRYERELDSGNDSYEAPSPAPYFAPSPEPERYDPPAPTPSWDSGSSSSDSYDSGSSSMDSGSSSSDSY